MPAPKSKPKKPRRRPPRKIGRRLLLRSDHAKMISELQSRGVSVSEIQKLIYETCKISVSRATIYTTLKRFNLKLED